MQYINVSEGDTFKRGDEMLSPVTGKWRVVPTQWYGMKVSWSDNNTFSHFKIQVRRSVETKETRMASKPNTAARQNKCKMRARYSEHGIGIL